MFCHFRQVKSAVFSFLLIAVSALSQQARGEAVDPVAEALNAEMEYSEAKAAEVDATLAEFRKSHGVRADEVYAGFKFLYNAEMADLAKAGVAVQPLTPEEEFRAKKLIDLVALTTNRHLFGKMPQSQRAKELQTDEALVTALQALQKTVLDGNSEQSAKIKGEVIGMALLGGIARERPSDLVVLDQFFRHLRPEVANPLYEILNEKREEITIGKFTGKLGEKFRGIEVNLPARVIKNWKESTLVQRVGWMTIVTADLGWALLQWYRHDPEHFRLSLAGDLRTLGVFLITHPPDEVNKHYNRSATEDYVVGFRMYARQLRNAVEKAIPAIAKLPFIPASEPNPLIRRHGYVSRYCRDIFVK